MEGLTTDIVRIFKSELKKYITLFEYISYKKIVLLEIAITTINDIVTATLFLLSF